MFGFERTRTLLLLLMLLMLCVFFFLLQMLLLKLKAGSQPLLKVGLLLMNDRIRMGRCVHCRQLSPFVRTASGARVHQQQRCATVTRREMNRRKVESDANDYSSIAPLCSIRFPFSVGGTGCGACT